MIEPTNTAEAINTAATFEPSSQSLLAGRTSADLVMEPYPHIVVKNALPSDYYALLESSFPSVDALKQLMRSAKADNPNNKSYQRTLRHLGRRNKRVNIPSALAIRSPFLTDPWRAFIDYHSSNGFFQEMINVFRPAIEEYFPDANLNDVYAARRGASESKDLSVDAMVAVNTPSWFKGEITGPHTDHPKKLFVGLYYMQDERDTAGGDLLIYKRKEPVTAKNLKWQKPHTVEVTNTVHYQPNTFVLLLNSPQSVHGVTTRKGSKYPRRFVNIIAERSKPFFSV